MKGARWLVHDGASPAGRQICITASVADQSASFEPSIVAAISVIAGKPDASLGGAACLTHGFDHCDGLHKMIDLPRLVAQIYSTNPEGQARSAIAQETNGSGSNDARLAKPLTDTCLSSRMENRKPSYRATWIMGGELIARIALVTSSREA